MTNKLGGILAAVSTPFGADGEVDEVRLRGHVDFLIDNGLHGLVPGGSTGEFAALTLDERKRVNEIVIEGIEIRPLGVDSIEFDEAGEAEISFVAIKPGSYHLKIPGSTGDTQQVAITIE